jgi:hypothetical protein
MRKGYVLLEELVEEKSETAYATLFAPSPPNGSSVAKEKQDAEIPIINSPPKIIRMKFCFTQDDDCDKYMLSHHQSVARRLDPYGVGTDPGDGFADDKTTSSLAFSSSDEEEEGDDIETTVYLRRSADC